MITSRKELKLYIMSDMMMNRGVFKRTIKARLKNIISPDYIMEYLKALRHVEFYTECKRNIYRKALYKRKWRKLGYKLGFSISPNVCGYGLVIPHYGTIVVGGGGNRIGNYCVLHTCVCITSGNKFMGNGLYCSTGCRILGDIELGDNVTIGANAVVNHADSGNCLLVGIPARKKADWGGVV